MRSRTVSILSLLLTVATINISVLRAAVAQAPSQKMRIGQLLTLSGNFASAGEDCRNGIEAALAELGESARIEPVFADTKNEVATAISEIRKLVDVDNVVAVYANRATIALPLNPISKRFGLPLVAAASHQQFVPGNQFAFQMWPSSLDEGEFLAEQFRAHGHKRIAIVHSEDEWTISSAAAFRRALQQSTSEVVFDQSVSTSDTDFQTLLTKIKGSNPDALYVNIVLAQLAPFFRQAHALKVQLPAYTNFYIAKPEVLDALQPGALENVHYYDIDVTLAALEKRLIAKGKKGVPPLTAVSYIATHLINQAASQCRSISSDDLHQALLRQTEVRTPDEVFSVVDRYLKVPLVLRSAKVGG